MDYLLLGRLAKLAALLGFALPWLTVSCSGTEILTATGWQLITGDPQPAGPLEGQQSATEDAEPAAMVIAAFAILALGLAASFLPKAKIAAAALLVGGFAGAGVSYYAVQNLKTEMAHELSRAQERTPDTGGAVSDAQARQMASSIASAIRVEEEEGVWVTIGGALGAGVLGLLALLGARRPDDDPAPSA